ncbi:hypothetical protein [Metabacillus fastidiosus]|uniref:hypothetical protein n=1 Tax=Metabacillus fastidiosus TaxID=1458 RepID=UPI002E1D7AA3|nr:hypothetical protein [Metabacillus fastidiosus]
MDLYAENKILTEEILTVYNSNFQKKLRELAEEKIVTDLSEIIKGQEERFSLAYLNSVHSGKYYNFIVRIKKENSLEEKIFRKNLIWKIASDLENVTNKQERENIINSFLYGLDDLIGIKILTQVKHDSHNVYDILKKSMKQLEELDISFYDFATQPKSMKNGMQIYNIKARYKQYNFELQIKSQIESAWADMDHEMFYKDYGITPIRKSVQQTMNKVGKLLHEVDDLLYSIRSSEIEFNKGENQITILRKINEEFQGYIKNKLKTRYNFDFGQYVDFYEYIINKTQCQTTMICKEKVIWPDFNYETVLESHKKYKDIHRRNYNVLVNEIVFASIKNFNSDKEISGIDLKEYLDLYTSYIVERYVDNDDFKEGIQKIIDELFNKCTSSSIYTDHEEYKYLEEYYALVYDEFINNLGLTEEEHTDVLNLVVLNFALFIFKSPLKFEEAQIALLFEIPNGGPQQIIRMFKGIEEDLKNHEKIKMIKKSHSNFENQISSFIEGDKFE